MADEGPATLDVESEAVSDNKPVSPSFVHDMDELDNELDRIMLSGSKFDACIDMFISRVTSFATDNTLDAILNQASSGYFYHALEAVPKEELEVMKIELQDNLNRLIPGYVMDGTEDILERVKGRFERRVLGFDMNMLRELKMMSALPVDTHAEMELKERAGLAEAASLDAISELKHMIDAQRATASFSCGGSIPIHVDTDVARRKNCTTSPPVTIFWGKKYDAAACKLVLPVDTSLPEASPDTLRHLVADCEAASFGRGQQDVIDPEYRKAAKLDTDQFATGFHPADFGILDHVGQILLPSISSEKDSQLHRRRLKAELYKLNVYSGPNGLFRKHVDTPRAENQIGSLVVCLPSKFTGGSLHVEHHGHKITFDWSDKSDATIQWAAFYSDCEHEIETVTHGDRITLTYNLYVTERPGELVPSPTAVIDPTTLSLYGWMKNRLARDSFMQNGGILGFYCSHAYAHSSHLVSTHLPEVLKGADLVLYSVFQSLGIKLSILPILYDETNKRRNYLKTDKNPLDPASFADTECEDIDQHWASLLALRQSLLHNRNSNRGYGAVVGTCRHSYSVDHSGREYEEDVEAIRRLWASRKVPGITWVTDRQHEEMAFSYLAYGNEASIGTLYSAVAILAVIPPAEERCGIFRQ
ncbi:hypothetical protein BJX63DRAFT_386943 [Aspergillus granulosus]|uniref:Fe2OG dioxygenase domain-containing protein n=1 Tax=Aspergillus granulosus TaxID=176169 RepID=A0ABR4HNB6_9EURO